MRSPVPDAFNEEDIRPAHLMDESAESAQADIARLLSRRAEFVRVPCPACDSSSSRPLFSKNGFDYEQCTACDTFYVNPRPSPAVLEWFYARSATYAFWNAEVFPAVDEARRKFIVAPRVDRILELCEALPAPTDSLLEIGAAFGTFCSEVVSRGRFKRVVAVEPTAELAKTCRARGIETVEKSFEAYAPSAETDRFSVVASFEVLEHLFSPRELIESAHRLLEDGGLLVLTCPNGRGFDIQVLGTVSDSVDHEHLNYFSPRSLASLLSSCGFEVVDIGTPGRLDAELVRKKALAREFDLSTQPFLHRVLVDDWDQVGAPFQKFLADNGLSSHLWIVGRKV